MDRIKQFCHRYRYVFLAAGYLLVLAAALMYLRVNASVPPEGDDKLTLSDWLYDFERMPFWQYLLQDLRWKLDFFTLKEFRFFPFHYPSAFSLLFFGSLTSYRLYIIAVTALAAALVSRVAARLCQSESFALAAFALAMGLAPLYNEGMYAYYAVPQKALAWAAASWLCLFRWEDTRHRRWAVAAAVLAFVSCGTYEIGYILTVVAFVLWLLRGKGPKGALRGTAPALGGMAVALGFHTAASLVNPASYSGNTLSGSMAEAPRVLVQQMAASLPFLAPLLTGQDPGVITKGDVVWPLALGLAAGLLLFLPRRKVAAKAWGVTAVFGLLLWAGPAALLAVSERYQQPEAITWKWGYIPAVASAVGMALLLAALLALLAGAAAKLPVIPSVLVRAVLAAALAAAIACNGAYTRACLREHHAYNLTRYEFFTTTVTAGLADEVGSEDMILCNEDVWGGSEEAESLFFSRWAGRELQAQVYGGETPPPDDLQGDFYAYQTYCDYGGYNLAWCGKAQDSTAELMDGMRVYVQSALVPDNAVLKYKVRLPDGTDEDRAICLLDLDQTQRDARGDYIVTVYDENIVNSKVMIWAG